MRRRGVWGLGGCLGVGVVLYVGACTPFLGPLPPDGGADALSRSEAGFDRGSDGLDRSPTVDALGDSAPNGERPPSGDGSQAEGRSDAGPCIASATPLRLISPLSTSFATSVRPTFTWEGAGSCGTTVALCRDSACAQIIQTVSVAAGASSARPTLDLPLGVVFWRARSGDAVTGVWSVFISRATTVDSSGGTFSDFNGDGRSDVAVQADNGVVLVYYGSADGLGTTPTNLTIPDATRVESATIASVGDISGDGLADLVVGLPPTDTDTHIQLYTFRGKPDGIDSLPSQTLAIDSFELAGQAFQELAVRGGLDVDHDGYGDVLVSWPDAGLAAVVHGAAGDALQGSDAPKPLDGQVISDAIATCDIDGDGVQDIVALVVPPNGGRSGAKSTIVLGVALARCRGHEH